MNNEFIILKCDGEALRFSDNIIVVYGEREEADYDCAEGEYVVALSKLPAVLLSKIINQSK